MITKEAIEAGCAATGHDINEEYVERILTAAFAAMSAEPRADDWSVDDTICARVILNYLGIGDDPSLDQYADRRRAKIAAFIADRVQSALSAMPVPAVRVKPLEWEDDGQVSRAKTVIGIYLVRPCLATNFAGQWVLDGIDVAITLHPSRDAAKAAAQADYEARILSALTPAPDLASENERLRATLEFVTLWAWREDPPNANRKLTAEERLSAIKYHPSIRAALEERT